MITGTKEELAQIVATHMCPEHTNPLVVAWHAGENAYVIRCGAGHFPEEVTREPSLTQMFKQGQELPEPIATNVKKGLAKRQPAPAAKAEDQWEMLLPKTDLATGEVLSVDAVRGLIDYARKYHLDPYRGHVLIMYSKPYFSIDAYLYHANKSGVRYSLVSHPMTKAEREAHQIPEGTHAWLSTVCKLDTQEEYTGLGIVTREEMTEESKKRPGQLRSPVVAAHPWQLAQKRAEWQAMRRGFPIGDTEAEKEE